MRVLIGLKHELLTYGLIQLLKDVQLISYMATAPTIEEFIRTLKKYPFDLIIIDIELEGAGGLQSVLTILKNINPSTKRVFMYNRQSTKLKELVAKREINGLFYEHATLKELMDFFIRVLNDEHTYLMMNNNEGDILYSPQKKSHDLSKREEEVFRMKIRGYTVLDTAELLNISPRTVENHRRNIRKKLEISKNSQWYEWGKRFNMI